MNEAVDPRFTNLLQAAGSLSVSLDRAAAERLLRFLDLLQRWNAVYNLTAVRNPNDMLVQHLFDCLAVIEPLRREFGESGRVLDVGSGGGLPGIVIAALCPNIDVVCVDTVTAAVRRAPSAPSDSWRPHSLPAPPPLRRMWLPRRRV